MSSAQHTHAIDVPAPAAAPAAAPAEQPARDDAAAVAPPSMTTPIVKLRRRYGGPRWNVVFSIAITALTIVGIEICTRTIGQVASPSPILLLAVCGSAFVGGLACGFVSAAMCMLFGAFVFSLSTWPLQYDADHTMQLVILSVTAPAMAILVGVLRRRAERAAAELARQQSERRFLKTFDRAAVGMATISLSGRWMRVNPELCQILGTNCEQLGGADWQATMLPEDAKALEPHVRQLLAGEIDWFQADTRHARPARGGGRDEIIWTQQTITLIRDDQGKPDHLIAVINDVSDRKTAEEATRRAQEAVRRSERQFRQAIIDAPIPIMMHAEDGQILQLSRAWTDYSGYTIQDIPRFDDWVARAYGDQRDADAVRASVAALFRGPAGVEMREQEFVITTKSGEPRVWSFSASSPGTLEDGRRYLVAMARDITLRKRAEERLAASELRYRSLVTATAQVVWRTSAEGDVVEDLPTWSEFTGQSFDEMKGRGWINYIHPDDREQVGQAWQESLRTHAAYENEFRVRAASGEWRQMLARGVPVIDDAGRVLEWVGSLRDVTERRRAEQQLRESAEHLRISRERLDLAVNGSELGLWYCDLPFDVLEWSEKTKEHFGLPPDAVVTIDTFWDRLHPDDRERTRHAIEAAIRNREPYDIDYRTVGLDGKTRWVRAIGRCFYDDQTGKPRRFDGITIDVTDRKQFEEQLRLAKQQAEGANRAKDQFLAALSHELRTPLTPVLLSSAALGEDESLPESVREDLDIIRRNVELEARLIDDLLDLTRVSRGKLQLDLRPVDVVECVEAAIDVCSDDAQSKNIAIRLELVSGDGTDAGENSGAEVAEPGCFVARADAARLQQVFWNLLKNAVKFTPVGGTVVVRCTRLAERPTLRVQVIDNGIGIERDVLPKIFDAFEQGDQSVSRQFGGLGLGLAISKAIVDLHGGGLSAHSDGRGAGATFTVDLPATLPAHGDGDDIVLPARRPEPSFREPAVTGATDAAGKPLRILLVEDHDATSRVLSMLLRRLNHDVTTAGTVAVARQAIARQQFDLLISDIGLPDGSGLDLMRELREHYDQRLKGICLSGYGMDQDVIESRAAGFSHHLTKPVDFPKLKATIDSVAP